MATDPNTPLKKTAIRGDYALPGIIWIGATVHRSPLWDVRQPESGSHDELADPGQLVTAAAQGAPET